MSRMSRRCEPVPEEVRADGGPPRAALAAVDHLRRAHRRAALQRVRRRRRRHLPADALRAPARPRGGRAGRAHGDPLEPAHRRVPADRARAPARPDHRGDARLRARARARSRPAPGPCPRTVRPDSARPRRRRAGLRMPSAPTSPPRATSTAAIAIPRWKLCSEAASAALVSARAWRGSRPCTSGRPSGKPLGLSDRRAGGRAEPHPRQAAVEVGREGAGHGRAHGGRAEQAGDARDRVVHARGDPRVAPPRRRPAPPRSAAPRSSRGRARTPAARAARSVR